MKLRTVKAGIAAAIIALGTAAYAAPASAGNFGVDIYQGYSGGSYHQGGHRQGGHWRPYNKPPRHYGGQRRHYGSCSPHEAVRKAHWLGMRHPGIRRVNHRAIVVTGFHRGHRAKIVFARNSPRCHVIGSRGI